MINRIFVFAAGLQNTGLHMTRWGIVVVLLWIGGLKAFRYEAAGIVPFVVNSPTMSFFYKYDAPEYKKHMNKEGEYLPENISWHTQNKTYLFSHGLGAFIIVIGLMIASYPLWPGVSVLGSLLSFIMSLVTLSFLITTPETFVQPLGDEHYGFPYLSGAGRLVIKDVMMMGGSIAVGAQAARSWLSNRRNQSNDWGIKYI